MIATILRLTPDEKSPVFLPREPDDTSNEKKQTQTESSRKRKRMFIIVADLFRDRSTVDYCALLSRKSVAGWIFRLSPGGIIFFFFF